MIIQCFIKIVILRIKYKSILSENVVIPESKKYFQDIKFKVKTRIYAPFKQHLIYFWDKTDFLWDILCFRLGNIKSFYKLKAYCLRFFYNI